MLCCLRKNSHYGFCRLSKWIWSRSNNSKEKSVKDNAVGHGHIKKGEGTHFAIQIYQLVKRFTCADLLFRHETNLRQQLPTSDFFLQFWSNFWSLNGKRGSTYARIYMSIKYLPPCWNVGFRKETVPILIIADPVKINSFIYAMADVFSKWEGVSFWVQHVSLFLHFIGKVMIPWIQYFFHQKSRHTAQSFHAM